VEAFARPTAFVTGADGFLGTELLKVLVARGHEVSGLVRSLEAAEQVRRAGATAIIGDLSLPGLWQDEASADWVFHVLPHPFDGVRAIWQRAACLTNARVLMDAHLLDAVASGATKRIVYVADASCYGATGPRPITEDSTPLPSVWGRCLTPALDRVEGYALAGLPIITALPGWIYGNASWFHTRVIRPVMAGHRVLQFGTTGPWVSPVHVEDCARALVHLAANGVVGGRYFVVNNDPVRLHEFATLFARLANRTLHAWRFPTATARFLAGPIVADHLLTDAVFSNIRLRGIGFRFNYPTLERGLQQVIGALDEFSTRSYGHPATGDH
jgi:nucleoside-diphosphate-sugar epimerase